MLLSPPPAAPGLADPPRDAQRVFRAAMDALARPLTPQPLSLALQPPAALPPELALLALTLCDNDTPLWLDAPLAADAAVSAWLRFHTGAALTLEPAKSLFALAADPARLPPLSAFAQGTEEYPDRSTTVILGVTGFHGPQPLTAQGPGVKTRASLSPTPLPPDFSSQWRLNRALFPRGVDVLFAGAAQVAALPRSSQLLED